MKALAILIFLSCSPTIIIRASNDAEWTGYQKVGQQIANEERRPVEVQRYFGRDSLKVFYFQPK